MNDKKNEHSQIREELEKLEKAMPIKSGGHLALLGTTLLVAIGGLLIRMVYLVATDQLVINDQWVTKFCWIALACWIFFIVNILTEPAPTVINPDTRGPARLYEWLKAYWQRNVRGNSAWLCLYEHDEMKVSIENPKNPLQAPPKNIHKGLKLAMLVPLGGWLNKPKRMTLYNSLECSFPVRRCKIRISNIFSNTKSIILLLQDNEGSKIRISARHLLDIIKNECYLMKGLPNNGIMGLIHNLHISEIALRSELEKVKSICTEKEDKLFNALDTLFRESQALKDTSRVGKSKEGKLIRERMESALLLLLPPDHAYRKVLEKT